MNFSQEEVDDFKSDALEMLDGAEDCFLKFDKGEDFKSTYDSVFRVFHSLKGGAGMTGLTKLQDHMHKVENLLVQCKTTPAALKQNVSFFLNAIDGARCLIRDEKINFKYELTSAASKETKDAPLNQSTAPTPIAPAASAPSQTPQPENKTSASPGTKNKFLCYIVDDEKEILEILTDILVEANFEVRAFDQSPKLVEAVRQKKPDVVISDMMMPEMNGIQVLSQIKQIDPELPVIFVSGHLSKNVLMDAVNRGVNFVIEKPIQDALVINQVTLAAKQYNYIHLLNRSLNLILYQYSDLDNYLQASGKEDVRNSIKTEINNVLTLRRSLQKLSTAS